MGDNNNAGSSSGANGNALPPNRQAENEPWGSGSFYTGPVVDGERHGFGTTVYQDGGKFVGEFQHNKPLEGTRTSPDGSRFVGRWLTEHVREGTMHDAGGGQQTGRTVFVPSKGMWMMDGPTTSVFPNGDSMTGTYSNYAMNGVFVHSYADGVRSELTFVNDALDGPGKVTYPDGRVFEGLMNEAEGRVWGGTLSFPNGDVYKGGYERDAEGNYKPGGHGLLRRGEDPALAFTRVVCRPTVADEINVVQAEVYEGPRDQAGRRHGGPATLTECDGTVYTGNFREGEKHDDDASERLVGGLVGGLRGVLYLSLIHI